MNEQKNTGNEDGNGGRSKKELLTEPAIYVRKWIAEVFR